ncbi:hypothetical protein B0H19DRAFT_1258596 [Mycena capillaripes]|nr:hypothetical protein B0H19DRAFT_1258596 [Mycena capillaripes]
MHFSNLAVLLAAALAVCAWFYLPISIHFLTFIFQTAVHGAPNAILSRELLARDLMVYCCEGGYSTEEGAISINVGINCKLASTSDCIYRSTADQKKLTCKNGIDVAAGDPPGDLFFSCLEL